MKIKYIGPEGQVSLSPEAGGITFRRGEPVEVDDVLAANLLEQRRIFAKAEPPRPRRRGSAAADNPGVETR